MVTVRFSAADLGWFASIGHDRNPLHLDATYAHRSPFGVPVVHGVLGALAMLASLDPREGQVVRRFVFEFPRPVFPELELTIVREAIDEGRETLQLMDGSLLLARGSVDFTAGDPNVAILPSGIDVWPEKATSLSNSDLKVGTSLSLPFEMTSSAYQATEARFGLHARGIDPIAANVLVATSYVVGMHLPGERALFSRLQLDFAARPTSQENLLPTQPFELRCSIRVFDARLGLLKVTIEAFVKTVEGADRSVATGELQAFVRESHGSSARALASELKPHQTDAVSSRDLEGKVALIIGGSRGLGAALALELASHGATVLASYTNTGDAARELERQALAASLPGRVETIQGDGGNPEWCASARRDLLNRFGALHLLFCNASPPLTSLGIDPDAHARLFTHIDRHVRLVGTPLTFFANDLNDTAGVAVLTSSTATQSVVPEWPHYIAAKSACESLFRVAARAHKEAQFMVVRPPQLRTDFAPALSGASTALEPEQVARAVIQQIREALALKSKANAEITIVDRFV